jgi:methyl-accepting chemotaxis protein I, serine sensor receptor
MSSTLHLKTPRWLIPKMKMATFEFHGVWSPGIRWMRALTLRGKVVTLLAAIILSVGPYVWEGAVKPHATVEALKKQGALAREVALGITALTVDHRSTAFKESISRGLVMPSSLPGSKAVMSLRGHLKSALDRPTPHSHETQSNEFSQHLRDDVDELVQLISESSRAMHAAESVSSHSSCIQAWLQAYATPLASPESSRSKPTPKWLQRRCDLRQGQHTGDIPLNALGPLAVKEMTAAIEQRLRTAQADAWRTWSQMIIGISATMYLGACAYMVLGRGAKHLNHQLGLFSDGDLSIRPQALGEDEIGKSLHTLCASLAKLCDLMQAVTEGVGSVSQASQQLAHGNADMTSRNAESADRLKAIVKGVTRYTETLQECRQQVEQVVTATRTLKLEAGRNRHQMALLNQRMASLQAKSDGIRQIVTTINGIAFRTNVLALNASVEASKAGAAGRGFAVVAQEVRSLAKRSAESAASIETIILESTEDIAIGSNLVQQASQTLEGVDSHVNGIHIAVQQVAKSSKEGNDATNQILDELKYLNEGLEKNQRLVEKLSSAADALSAQGVRLQLKVRHFKV